VLSKSAHRDRIADNGRSFDFELTGGELSQLDALDRPGGTGNALESKWWKDAREPAQPVPGGVPGQLRTVTPQPDCAP
jgi:diketogulonate reductase-like aldo/keto reductase